MTDARLTQASLEQWSQPNADAQLTSIVIEQWASVQAGTGQALMTSIALEMWAVVPLPPPRGGQTAVTVNSG